MDPAHTGASREDPGQHSAPDSTRNGRSFQETGSGLCSCRQNRRLQRSSGVSATQSRLCEVMADGGKKSPGRCDPLSPTGACTGGLGLSENVSSGSGPGMGEPCCILDPQHAPILTDGRHEPPMYTNGVRMSLSGVEAGCKHWDGRGGWTLPNRLLSHTLTRQARSPGFHYHA